MALRYLPPPAGVPVMLDGPCSSGEPSTGDWADAITPSAAEREAIARARREGWIRSEIADRLAGQDARERRIAGLPGQGTADARQVPEIMAAYYRQEAERHLFRLPTRRVLGEAVVPTTLDDWETGDAVREHRLARDLCAAAADVLGAAQPLRRDIVAESRGPRTCRPGSRGSSSTSTSAGSMPNPIVSINAMTLAAADPRDRCDPRRGRRARAAVLDRDDRAAGRGAGPRSRSSRFLMHYIGAGTQFPFDRLAASVRDCGRDQPNRVVITDRDFDHNYDASPAHTVTVAEAASRGRLVLLLHDPDPARARMYEALGASVVAVAELDDFPRAAAGLARALFEVG